MPRGPKSWNRSPSQHLGKLVERHMTETENDIKKAAKEIRAKLEEHPVLLRTPRACARVTANVTGALVGFLVPVKGGIVYDLIEELLLAPAIVGSVEAATTGRRRGLRQQLQTRACPKS